MLLCLPVVIIWQLGQAQVKTGSNLMTGDVTVYWRSADTAIIKIGTLAFVFPPYGELGFPIPANDRLLVQVKTRAGTYHADHYLIVNEGKGYLSIELSRPDLIMKYTTGSKQKSCLDEIAANMVAVTGGSFKMGNENGGPAEKPIHTVRLKNFAISKYEVTQEQWKTLMGENPGYFKNCPQCPVENISWDDAMRFIKRLNELSGKPYRLPTEAEWEYAAKGGNETAHNQYSGSNTLNDVAWYYLNSHRQTHPVGTKMPNELGLYDMTGNVWEWCHDWYGETYYVTSPVDNPQGPINGELHVLRGGSWFDFDIESRTTYRFRPLSDYRMYILGFRLAMNGQ